MSKKDVIVLNSHGVGQYAYADHMPVWGETLCVTKWHVAEDGGKGSNVSVALGRLGIDTAYIGKVGNDPWGDLGEKWMQDAGVDTTYLYRTDEVSTGTGLILIGPDGQNTVIDGDSSSVKLTLDEVKAALDAMKGTRMFVTGFEVPEQLSLDAARYAKELGMVTLVNPSPLPEKPMGRLDYVDYLFINEVEGRYILDLPQDSPILPQDMLNKVQEKYGRAQHHHDHGRRRKRGPARRRILDRGIGEGGERGQHRWRRRRLYGRHRGAADSGQGFEGSHPLGQQIRRPLRHH